MDTANFDHHNDYGRRVQDRLGTVLHRLASFDADGSAPNVHKGSDRASAEMLRKISADLERSLVELQEASRSHERLRSLAEHALQRAELLFLISPVPCVILDRSSIVIDANPAATKAVNLSQRHLVGKPFHLFVGSNREDFLATLGSLERDRVTRWPVSIRPRERGALRMTIAAAVDEEDRVVAMLMPGDAGRDVTDAIESTSYAPL
jgi:PAS domain-containing protein